MSKAIDITGAEAKLLNYIRNNASVRYQDFTPSADPQDLLSTKKTIWKTFMTNPGLKNEFVEVLLQRIAFVRASSKSWKNKLALYKKGKIDFGGVIEDIFVSIANVYNYDIDVAEKTVWKREDSDIKSAFYTLNYQVQYPGTTYEYQLRTAFLAEGGIYDLVGKIVESLYTGEQYDEYQVMLFMVGRQIVDGRIFVKGVSNISYDDQIAAMREISLNSEFMTDKYNQAGVKTHTEPADKTILLTTAFTANTDVKVLASAFNLEYVDFLGQRVLFNGFENLDRERLQAVFTLTDANGNKTIDPDYEPLTDTDIAALSSIGAIFLDKEYFQIYDYDAEMTSIFNPKGHYTNYWYTVRKVMATSPFAQAVVFVPGTPTVDTLTISPKPTSSNYVTVNLPAGYSGGVLNILVNITTSYFASKGVKFEIAESAVVNGTTYTTDADAFIDAAGNVSISNYTPSSNNYICVKATSTFDNTKTDELVIKLGNVDQ